MDATATVCELLGLRVTDAAGIPVGRLTDLAVSLGPDGPRVSSIRVKAEGHERALPWSAVLDVDGAGLRVASAEHAEARPPAELLLARDVLDRQIFDTAGKHVTRVDDVALRLDGTTLRVVGVETGPAALLRRLRLAWVARRLDRSLIDWDDLHLLSGPGHALQLASPTAAVHRLDEKGLVELVHRAPRDRAAAILAALPAGRAARLRAAVARRRPRRRSSDPLSVRKRAPS
jgi:sporulation protein YlmC with PRC-barrel domain